MSATTTLSEAIHNQIHGESEALADEVEAWFVVADIGYDSDLSYLV